MDTNVLLAGLRSKKGASFELLRLLRAGKWKLVLSNTVLAECEEVVKREVVALGLTLIEADFPACPMCHRNPAMRGEPCTPFDSVDQDLDPVRPDSERLSGLLFTVN